MSYLPDPGRYSYLDYRRCGRSGLLLPPVSLGLWHNFGAADDFENARQLIHGAFDAGITYFDLANNYGPPPGAAEECFGRIFMQDLSRFRDELVIATKAGHLMWAGPYGDWGSRKHMLASLDQSLSRMKLDYVDIFMRTGMTRRLRWKRRRGPSSRRSGPERPCMPVFPNSRQSKPGRYAPCSGRPASRAWSTSSVTTCSTGSRKSPFFRPSVKRAPGASPFPLAQGMLTDRYLEGIPADSRAAGSSVFLTEERVREHGEKIRSLAALARGRGQSLAQMALAWVLRDPVVTTALIGASRPQQVMDCLKALENTRFTAEELSIIDGMADR